MNPEIDMEQVNRFLDSELENKLREKDLEQCTEDHKESSAQCYRYVCKGHLEMGLIRYNDRRVHVEKFHDLSGNLPTFKSQYEKYMVKVGFKVTENVEHGPNLPSLTSRWNSLEEDKEILSNRCGILEKENENLGKRIERVEKELETLCKRVSEIEAVTPSNKPQSKKRSGRDSCASVNTRELRRRIKE